MQNTESVLHDLVSSSEHPGSIALGRKVLSRQGACVLPPPVPHPHVCCLAGIGLEVWPAKCAQVLGSEDPYDALQLRGMSFSLSPFLWFSEPRPAALLWWWAQPHCFRPCPPGSHWWRAILALERFVRVTDRAAGKRVGEQMPKALFSLLGKC